MYGVGVSVPPQEWENPWEREQRLQREAREREIREAMQRAMIAAPQIGQLTPPKFATIAELEALTKRIEALEQAVVAKVATKRKRRAKR